MVVLKIDGQAARLFICFQCDTTHPEMLEEVTQQVKDGFQCHLGDPYSQKQGN